MNRLLILGFISALIFAQTGRVSEAQEIGFVETFALSDDRESALKELVPGTAVYYLFHCLHYQNTKQFEQAEKMMRAWKSRHGDSTQLRQMQHRQSLLTYPGNAQETIDYLVKKLDVRFNHERKKPSTESDLPAQLDSNLISYERLSRRALQRKDTNQFEDVALRQIANQSLSDSQLRDLLKRLSHPAIPNLPALVAKDLRNKNASAFGSYPIHGMLLRDQLDELLDLIPELRNQDLFINIYLSKLRPNNDVSLELDRGELAKYLDRLWDFVSQLKPLHNSLKANVLYQRLQLDRSMGVYDKKRFIEYLQLPRQMVYVRSDLIKQVPSNRHLANLQKRCAGLPPVVNDESLVRDYLHHFFVQADGYEEFTSWVREAYLKERFAEAKITAGLGDTEQWVSWLSPAKYQSLMKRVDLEFSPSNSRSFGSSDSVEIKLTTKNVSNLIVKIFEINTGNFYRNQFKQIGTNINLDGLVPNWQRTFDYQEASARRVERTFTFDEIDHPGVFVVDFIGNGQSSRMLIRKGKLTHVMETTAAGQEFRVFDEARNPVMDASLWVAGVQYKPNQQGRFLVPFSNQPKQENVIIERGGFSVLAKFKHESESWKLRAGLYVDRESLRRGGEAEILVRPQLLVNGSPAPIGLLEQPRLIVRSTDLDGIQSTKEFTDISLAEEHETTVEIRVPPRLKKLELELRGSIEKISQSKSQALLANQSYELNGIDLSESLETVHLRRSDDGFALSLRGKSGEIRPSQSMLVKFKHRLFRQPISANLQTDVAGQVQLGELVDIESIEVTPNGNTTRSWVLPQSQQTQYASLNASSTDTIQIPCDTADKAVSFALLEICGDQYVKDLTSQIVTESGLVSIKPLPVGDYVLLHLSSGNRQKIQVTEGKANGSFLMGKHRTLEIRAPRPLHVTNLGVTDGQVQIQLGGEQRFARVHVIATRFLPRFDWFSEMAQVRDMEPLSIRNGTQRSSYIEGRTLGEEYQYILERQFHKKYPGNLLTRPSLLLNPWALKSTENEIQAAAAGEEFYADMDDAKGATTRARQQQKPLQGMSDFANLDFLPEGSVVLANLAVGDSGLVEFDSALLGEKQMIHVVVTDPHQTIYRTVSMSDAALQNRDLRLLDALDPAEHFAQQKRVKSLQTDGNFELTRSASAKFRQYDDLADVHRFFVDLTGNSQLAEFGFLINWPKLTAEEKLRQYKKYACHELHFFLMKKDPEYFETVIRPYLANKFQRTFMDEFLLGNELELWARPWDFEQLNTVEQILFGRRMNQYRNRLDQRLKDDYEQNPTSRRKFDRFFDFAVASNSMDNEEKSIELTSEPMAPPSASKAEAASRGLGGGRGRRSLAARPKQKSRAAPEESAAGKEVRNSLGRVQNEVASVDKRSESDELYFDGEQLKKDRTQVRQYYQRTKPTQEWVENNYYQVTAKQQNPQLMRVNRFWRDYALHADGEPFLSPYFAESSRNFAEMMFALAVLDLPFVASEHDVVYSDSQMKLTAKTNLIAFFEQVSSSELEKGETNVLISENFFRANDRYRVVEGKKQENFVREEFLPHVLYGGQIVMTNPTSAPQGIDLLVQIPEGALPVKGSHFTKTQQLDLAAFSTQTMEYFFYFPTSGDYSHFPAHLSINAKTIASAEAMRFNVVEKLSKVDTQSWAWLSQNGTEQQVLGYLGTQNLQAIDLSQIAFRMKEPKFFRQVLDLLTERFSYNGTLWSYALMHRDEHGINEYLQHRDGFVDACGVFLESPLLTIRPVLRNLYEHREYWPLVNARVHRLGSKQTILNDAIWQQYHRLLEIVSRQEVPGNTEQLAITYYLLLQDRIEEALARFQSVDPSDLASRMQYDYCAAYLAMYEENPQRAEEIAGKYLDYPIKRWRDLFAGVDAQVKEILGGPANAVDEQDAKQRHSQAAGELPTYEFVVESLKTKINYQNLEQITINYYQMDVELLFSRNPFVKQKDDNFALIKPNFSQTITLPSNLNTLEVDLPEQFRTSNVLVELVGNGETDRQAYYANSMNLQVLEPYGQLKVTKANSDELLSKVYVKVYARMKDGRVQFYKDGYTDLRGRFDYASLSNQSLSAVERFAVLVVSPDFGAIVQEAGVPKE